MANADTAAKPSLAAAYGNLSLLRRLVGENARDFIPSYIVAFILLAVTSGMTAWSAYLLKDVINGIFADKDVEAVTGLAILVAVIFMVKGAAGYGNTVILGRIGNAIVERVRGRLFAHLQRQSLAFHRKHTIGELVNLFTLSSQSARVSLELIIVSVGRDALTLIGLVAVMVALEPWLTLLVVLVGPPAVIGTATLMRNVKKITQKTVEIQGRILSLFKEAVAGLPVVKAFTMEDAMERRLGRELDDAKQRMNRIVELTAAPVPMMEALGGVAVAAFIFYGGGMVAREEVDPGSFFALLGAILMAYDPARRLSRVNVTLQSSLVGVKLLYETLDQPSTDADPPGVAPLDVKRGAVRFEGVTFGYGAERPAIAGLTLDCPPGAVTALVGPSGAGKSTLLALLCRFYEPESGRIEIDGRDIAGATLSSLRGSIALVNQETFLFDGTIRENVMAARPEASEAEFLAAARDAHVDEFALSLPEGFESPVGEAGVLLSGGQRQRVAIARAMLRDAPILLLDEATSALDAVSEAAVQAALERLMQGRTTLVIAHRLSTVRRAAKIVAMDQGRVVETGDHAALLAKGGLYARLYALQFGAAAAE